LAFGGTPKSVMTRRTVRLCAALAAAATLITAGPVRGDHVRDERHDLARRRAAIQPQIDLAEASDEKVDQELRRLESEMRSHRASAATARSRAADAQSAIRAQEDRIAALDQRLEGIRADLVDRAVAAYVLPQGSPLGAVVDSRDLNDSTRRMVMVEAVQGQALKLTEELRRTRREMARAIRALEDARDVAREQAGQERAALGSLGAAKDQQRAVEAELERRIVALRDESTALLAEEGRITQILKSEEEARAAELARQRAAREAALREAARRAEAERAAQARRAAEAGSRRAVPASRAAPPPARPGVSPAPPPVPSPQGFIWPVNGRLTSRFGPRWGSFHAGIDLAAPTGTPIKASKDGIVAFAGWMGGYGNMILIDHGGGHTTGYGHQSRLAVRKGQYVDQGQIIGYVGSTGHSTGPHLHFEVRVNGVARNPLNYLP
jgi:murein DD-endopeptidase MepM/ murein hydrolase activator NlpD